MKLARVRKAVVATLGTAATIAVGIPQGSPLWKYAQVVLGLATIAGVYRTPNDLPAKEAQP